MEFALFGQASQPITRTLTATAGVRVTLARSAGSLLDKSKNGSKEPSSTALPALPSFAVDWQPSRSFSSFVHFQKGFRAGGLAVAPPGDALDSRKFAADDLSMTELGVRWGRRGEDRLSIHAAIFFADWNHIQADLVDTSGLPYTANVGDGRVYGLDAEITWRLSPALTLTGAAFVNNSKLYAAEADFGTSEEQTLPNVPRNGTRAAATWQKTIAEGVNLSADVSVRYIGQSRLGVGPVLNIPQGQYAVGDMGGRLGLDRFGVSLDIDNIGDVRANSFAFGNPFSVAEHNQMTPLRPRTIRLGFDVRF
jgi:iron complex outermembrane receptor protein